MSNSKVKSFLPLPPILSSDDESAKNSPVPMKDKVAVLASQIAQSTGAGSSNISPVPTRGHMKAKYGQLLTPVPGRLTPTVHHRIKAPPVGATALKRVASSIDEFNTAGVCFTAGEAESCAEKALVLGGKDKDDNTKGGSTEVEETPLNIERCDAGFSWKSAAESAASGASTLEWNRAPHQFVSSSSTVVTTSSASSCGRSSMGSEIAVVAVAVSKEPPLKVVRTDSAVNAEEENGGGGGSVSMSNQAQDVAVADKTPQPTARAPEAQVPEASSAKPLSTAFTNNLVKENSSRQGRSLQRWLVHSPTEELVRQVAGTIPITRDGRIILVSASRKTEWILPKGGWDTDESREECATRETYEEAGVLGKLGACLEPIDYETRKARKRRLSKMAGAGGGSVGVKKLGAGAGESKTGEKVDGWEAEGSEGLHPPLHKRAKTEEVASKPSGHDASSSSTKNAGSLDSTCSNIASGAAMNQVSAAHPSSTPSATAPAAAASFDPKNYSYVRLSLFPLYVTSVKSDWPEKGRLRKLVDIDEAIRIMEAENRPYFKRGLEMVKQRGLIKAK